MDDHVMAWWGEWFALNEDGPMKRHTEVILATPHALLHFHHIVNEDQGAKGERLVTTVKAMSRGWWPDAHRKVVQDDLFRAMNKRVQRAAKQGSCGGSFIFKNIHDAITHFNLDKAIKKDTKAQNAVLTALGQDGALRFEQIVEKAKAERERVVQAQLAAISRKRALTDEMWGVF